MIIEVNLPFYTTCDENLLGVVYKIDDGTTAWVKWSDGQIVVYDVFTLFHEYDVYRSIEELKRVYPEVV